MDTINTIINSSASYGFDAYSKACGLSRSLYQNGANACNSVLGNVSYADAKNYLYTNGTSCLESLKNTATTLYTRTVTDYMPAAEKGFSGLQRISTAFGEKVRKNAPESMQGAFVPSQATGMSGAVMTVAVLPFAVPYLESQLTNYSCGRELSRQKQLQQEVMANAAKQTLASEETLVSLQERAHKLKKVIDGRKAILNRSCFSLSNLAKTLLVAGSSFVLAPYVTGAQLGVYAGAGIAHMVYRNVSNTSQTRSQVAELESMRENTVQTMKDKFDLKSTLTSNAQLSKDKAKFVEERNRAIEESKNLEKEKEKFKESAEKYEELSNDRAVALMIGAKEKFVKVDKNKEEIVELEQRIAALNNEINTELQDIPEIRKALQDSFGELDKNLANP